MSAALVDLMAKIEDAALFRRVGAGLAHAGPTGLAAPAPAPDRARFAKDGWLELQGAALASESAPLVACIERLLAEGLPPLFVYVFDETWAIGSRVAGAISAGLGAPYELLADAWAFHVPPGPENAGWAPHRGSYELADRAAPELVNVWVALTDVTIASSCIHVVPLEADVHYPNDLASHDVRGGAARALPARAGTALVWNANVLHWGGPSSAGARGPRVSITFTLRRTGAARAGRAVVPSELDMRARVDLVADQVLVYGRQGPGVSAEMHEWARLTRGLSAALSRRKER